MPIRLAAVAVSPVHRFTILMGWITVFLACALVLLLSVNGTPNAGFWISVGLVALAGVVAIGWGIILAHRDRKLLATGRPCRATVRRVKRLPIWINGVLYHRVELELAGQEGGTPVVRAIVGDRLVESLLRARDTQEEVVAIVSDSVPGRALLAEELLSRGRFD